MLIITKNIVLAFIKNNSLDYKFYRNAVQINSFLKTGKPDTQLRCGIIIEDENSERIGCWNDWVAGEKGNFIKLVKLYYGCSWHIAEQRLMAIGTIKIKDNIVRKKYFQVPRGISVFNSEKAMQKCASKNISNEEIFQKNIYISTDKRKNLSQTYGKIIIPTITNNKITGYTILT